ncbi:MAG: hypothetical protein M1819_005833 [Sarea resinae]|nr:MAG: hypothetical protein M1819_005833 [Sarea resinae]
MGEDIYANTSRQQQRQPNLNIMAEEKELQVTSGELDASDAASTELDKAADDRLMRKCDLHIIPILFILYLFSFLDRVNIGNARIQGLEKSLHMKGNEYNVALLVFFIPYVLLEVPSNLILKRVAPSTWLSGIMFCWGICTMCQGFTKSYGGLVACRFLMGIFEAGFLPGVIYLLSMYYKRLEFQRRFAVFFASSLLAGAFGGLLAFAIAHMNGTDGYEGWRWIFIIEGICTIALAMAAKFLIVDWPETANFLSADDRVALKRRINNDTGIARMDRLDRTALKLILSDWKIWAGGLMYLGVGTSGYATSFFIPTILREFGYSATASQVHTIPIYIVCTVVSLIAAYFTDRLHHRYAFTLFGVVFASIGYIILLAQGGLPVGVKYMAVFFVTSGIYITQPITIGWLANNVGGHYKRAFSSAIQISLGNCSGFVGSLIFLTKEAPRYPRGYGAALAMLLFCGIVCTVTEILLIRENRKRDAGGRDYRYEYPKERLDNIGDDHPDFRFVL